MFIMGCAAAFGPGFTIDKQDIDVQFEPGPPPRIAIKSNYELTNNGTRPLVALELRLPTGRQFRSENVALEWDGQPLRVEESSENARNTLMKLPQTWAVSGHHHLRIVMDLKSPGLDESGNDSYLRFAPDAFFLPAEGWTAELLPPRGAFATGGVPPAKWNLTVSVPQEFVVHTSGDKVKRSKHGNEATVRATQRVTDIYPLVVAGRYVSKQIGSERQKIYLWTRKAQDTRDLRPVSDSLVKTMASYDSVFGERSAATVPTGFFGRHRAVSKNAPPLWLVECPVIPGCFSNRNAGNGRFPGAKDQARAGGEMISADTAMIDPGPDVKDVASAVAPALAASWLGYGKNPGFYEQEAPLSAFPAFAAAVGAERLSGTTARNQSIRRALAIVPTHGATSKNEDQDTMRAKSFLFFYGLEDRYGRETFRKAIRHMLNARRNSGFDLDDLIAAFDEEAHGNTAEFVRLWMKHPGVPAEFRARYENGSAPGSASSKESMK
jgi:hypothetical protein